FVFQAEDGIRDWSVTGVQTCALPIFLARLLLDTVTESAELVFSLRLFRSALDVSPRAIALGAGAGLAATLVAAFLPARTATAISPPAPARTATPAPGGPRRPAPRPAPPPLPPA